MGCHSQIFSTSPFLEPIRESFRSGQSIRWTRVHDLPDFVYFDHSIHIHKGVGCTTCHGPVDRMPIMYQGAITAKDWCVDCHREPERFVRRGRRFRVRLRTNRPTSGKLGEVLLRNIRFRSSRAARRATDEVRSRTAGAASDRQQWWRTLEERAGEPCFASACMTSSGHRSPRSPIRWSADRFEVHGASLALAGVTAARATAERIVPYVRSRRDRSGRPLSLRPQ